MSAGVAADRLRPAGLVGHLTAVSCCGDFANRSAITPSITSRREPRYTAGLGQLVVPVRREAAKPRRGSRPYATERLSPLSGNLTPAARFTTACLAVFSDFRRLCQGRVLTARQVAHRHRHRLALTRRAPSVSFAHPRPAADRPTATSDHPDPPRPACDPQRMWTLAHPRSSRMSSPAGERWRRPPGR